MVSLLMMNQDGKEMNKKRLLLILLVAMAVCTKGRKKPDSITVFQEVDGTPIDMESDLQKKKVALTFDDGPSGMYTECLLDALKERNVKATFFVMGENIEGNEEILIRMINEGHVVGNHTYSHVDLANMEFEEACEEINQTNAYIYNLTGYTPTYIRPPYGSCGDRILEATNMSVVLWNVDPMDWKDQNASVVTKRIINDVEDGDIILLHDIFKSSVDAAINVIDQLNQEGYEFVTIDELRNNTKIIKGGE